MAFILELFAVEPSLEDVLEDDMDRDSGNDLLILVDPRVEEPEVEDEN